MSDCRSWHTGERCGKCDACLLADEIMATDTQGFDDGADEIALAVNRDQKRREARLEVHSHRILTHRCEGLKCHDCIYTEWLTPAERKADLKRADDARQRKIKAQRAKRLRDEIV